MSRSRRLRVLFFAGAIAWSACGQDVGRPSDNGHIHHPPIGSGDDAAMPDASVDASEAGPIEDSGSPDASAGPAPGLAFVSATSSNAVHVFDARTRARLRTISVCAGPNEIQATADGRWVWVICETGGAVAFLNPATLSVARTLDLGGRPTHSYLAPDGASVWIGNDTTGNVHIVDLADFRVTNVLSGNGHHKIAFATDRDGALRAAYVSNAWDSNITVIGPTRIAAAHVAVDPEPHGIDFSPSTGNVYNCGGQSAAPRLEVIGTAGANENVRFDAVTLLGNCNAVRAVDGGRRLAVVMGGRNLLGEIDLTASRPTRRFFPTGRGPDGVARLASGVYLVANVIDATVSVIDPDASMNPAATIWIGPAGVRAEHRAIRCREDSVRAECWVPNAGNGTVSVIDGASLSVVATLADIPAPNDIAFVSEAAASP